MNLLYNYFATEFYRKEIYLSEIIYKKEIGLWLRTGMQNNWCAFSVLFSILYPV